MSSNQHPTEDQISRLPNPVLSHILSFLPTKSAVATSILSTRWKCMWTELPVIDLGEEVIHLDEEEVIELDEGDILGDQDIIKYQNIVFNVLLHNKEQYLRFCRLTIPCDSLQCAESWLHNLVRRNVKEMYLRAFPECMFPGCTFTYEKLIALTLTGGDIPVLSATMHLPNLLFLKLFRVVDLNCRPCLEPLASSCPILSELIIEDYVGPRVLTVSSSSIKKLQLIESEFMCMEAVVIDTPGLEYLLLSHIVHLDMI